MAAVSWSALRSTIATQVLTVAGFVESRFALDLNAMPSTLGDRAFSVLLGSDNDLTVAGRWRNKPDRGAQVNTLATVTFARKVKVDAQTTTVGDGYDDAHSIVQALADGSVSGLTQTHLFFLTMRSRAVPGGAWVIYSAVFRVEHTLALQ